eukprot:Transcript_4832.p1 GENE.Transcript_4832~~Transcript_4832.p1  ORF type:complete len:1079 (-),score=354.18 Transcript_4832:42-3278(-)
MFPPDNLEGMLNISMRQDKPVESFNEVVLDAPTFLDSLPRSVAAFVYGLHSHPTPRAWTALSREARSESTYVTVAEGKAKSNWCPTGNCQTNGKSDEEHALESYVAFLAAYNLSETDVPLLKANFDTVPGPVTGDVFTDESAKARPLLAQAAVKDLKLWKPPEDSTERSKNTCKKGDKAYCEHQVKSMMPWTAKTREQAVLKVLSGWLKDRCHGCLADEAKKYRAKKHAESDDAAAANDAAAAESALAPGGDPMGCLAVRGAPDGVDDDWCRSQCAVSPDNCPKANCFCEDDNGILRYDPNDPDIPIRKQRVSSPKPSPAPRQRLEGDPQEEEQAYTDNAPQEEEQAYTDNAVTEEEEEEPPDQEDMEAALAEANKAAADAAAAAKKALDDAAAKQKALDDAKKKTESQKDKKKGPTAAKKKAPDGAADKTEQQGKGPDATDIEISAAQEQQQASTDDAPTEEDDEAPQEQEQQAYTDNAPQEEEQAYTDNAPQEEEQAYTDNTPAAGDEDLSLEDANAAAQKAHDEAAAAAAKNGCKSISPSTTDDWCQLWCPDGNCPDTTVCLCNAPKASPAPMAADTDEDVAAAAKASEEKAKDQAKAQEEAQKQEAAAAAAAKKAAAAAEAAAKKEADDANQAVKDAEEARKAAEEKRIEDENQRREQEEAAKDTANPAVAEAKDLADAAPDAAQDAVSKASVPPPKKFHQCEAGMCVWALDNRNSETPGQLSGCPEGQRNANHDQCVGAVRQATEQLGLEVNGFKLVNSGDGGNNNVTIPTGCSYSRHSKMAIFNTNEKGQSHPGLVYQLVCLRPRHERVEEDQRQDDREDLSQQLPAPEVAWKTNALIAHEEAEVAPQEEDATLEDANAASKTALDEAVEAAAKNGCTSISATATDDWCQMSCPDGSCPETLAAICQCGGAQASPSPLAAGEAQPAAEPAATTCKSLNADRVGDDWCDQSCVRADGSHVTTEDGCDPAYCDCPWEQAAPPPQQAVQVRRDGSIIKEAQKPPQASSDAGADAGAEGRQPGTWEWRHRNDGPSTSTVTKLEMAQTLAELGIDPTLLQQQQQQQEAARRRRQQRA